MKSIAMLLLLLVPQDQTAEAKKLLEALAPKDPAFSQIEWQNGPNRKGIGYFAKGKAWRLDTAWGDNEMIFHWDGKTWTNFMKNSNRYMSTPKPSVLSPLLEGGALAEIFFSGNGDRLLAGNKATVKKEKLDEVDCSHIVIRRPDAQDSKELELHFWIDAAGSCRRYTRKTKADGKVYEQSFVYKAVDPPTAGKDVFDFKVPADAKELGK
jgi:hypothetical protein